MSDIGKAFDKRFGTNRDGFLTRKQLRGKTLKGKIPTPLHRGQVHVQQLTDTQRKWMELMFPKNQKQQELICCLKSVSGKVDCTAVRHVDFAPIEEYFSGREGGELSPNEGNIPVAGDWGKLNGFRGDGFYRFSWKFSNLNRQNACEICVDASAPLRFVSAREFVLGIRQSVESASPRYLDQLNRDDETIQNELTNSDDKVFLYELLQNANDYPCPGRKVRVEIRLDKDCLCFRHTGREFSALNVNALCSAGAGDKSDNPNAIGYKGIGFKTVFRNNSRVYLKSGEYSFWFDRERAKREVKINAPWRRVPIWDDVNYSDMGEFRVGFKLYPDRSELLNGTNEDGYRCILRRLFKDERVLLFIPELSDVSIQTSDDEKWCVSKRSGSWCVSDLPPVELPDSVKDEIDREVKVKNIPPKLKGKEKTLVTFACNINGRKLLPVENACLYCFLPAERARWGFPFLMNTDMIPTGPRDDVRADLKLNQQLSRIAGEEFCKWINSLLKSGKYDYDSVFALIPDIEGCINKTEIPAVKKFLQEFSMGFESGIEQMVLPTNDGSCVLASECIFDKTGVLRKFGSSFWRRLNDNRCIVAEQLWGCDAFARFVKKYGDRIKINTFDFADLRNSMSSSAEFATWVQNPMANGSFLRFLVEAGELKTFKDAPIFLDNHKNVGAASEMYFYGQGMQLSDRYLGAFSKCYRCLSKDSACLKEIEETIGNSFKPFGPRTFLVENILSQAAINNTREALKEIDVAKGFWSFIAHYRMWKGKERFADDYALLGGLPFTTETGDVCESIVNDEYSVYVADEHSDSKILGYEWFKPRVRFVNHKYFEGGEGAAIKDLLTSRLFANKKRLVGRVEALEVLVSVFDKFKENILADIKTARSDMGVYDFLSSCAGQNIDIKKWLEKQIAHWPVEDVSGELIERDGKSVWYYSEHLVGLLSNGWIKGEEFVVLSQKYQKQMALFDVIGAKDFEKVGFGELFRNEICPHLNKMCADDDIVAFHKYMQKQVAADLLVSKPQFDALKNTPVIVHTKDGVCRLEGCEGALICQQQIDVALEVSEWRLPESVKVLDSCLCGTAEMVEYWQKLGCMVLDEGAVLKQTIAAYHECQLREGTNAPTSDEFKNRHVRFVKSMIGANVDIALLRGVKLLDANGHLTAPENLVLSEVYEPVCHFQKYGCDLNFVSECYSIDLNLAKVAECLRMLGVRDEFQAQDVGCLSVEGFCKYYWTEYSLSHAPTDEVVKAMKSVPSVLDRTGHVRKPSELYSACLEHPYLVKIGDTNKLLPLCEGVNTESYESLNFRDSLTASDAISFLLADSDGAEYQFRGRALGWIANGNLLPADRERYRKDERAAWRNLKNGQMTNVEKLCVIKSHGANRVRAHFGNCEFVVDLRNICTGDQEIGKGDVERAFEKLGVVLVDNSALEPLPSGEAIDGCIKNDIKVRLLILLAVSGEDNWEEEYAKKEAVLDGCGFKVCDSIVERCVTFDQLRSEHGKFSEKDGVVYYVGGWQDKHVFLDVVKYLKKRLELGEYTDEDLKEAFDTDGGDRKLVDKILSVGDRLLRDNLFMQKLGDVSHSVMQAVKDKLAQSEREKQLQVDLSNNGLPNEVESNVEQEKISSESSQSEEAGADLNSNAPENNQPQEPEREKHWIGEYEVDEDEYSQLSQIFTDGDSSDDVETAKKKDENKLACLRLFNQLEAQGLEPCMDGHREIEYVVRKLYAGLGKSGPNIDINTGERLHVISAMGGVGYIPPKWWNKVVNNENGTNVICAVTGASKENCVRIRNYRDLLTCVGDNAIPVKIRGANAEERVCIATNWFSSVDVSSTAGKIYALLKLRDKTAMNTAFEKGFCSDEMSKYEETHNNDL